MKNRRLIFLRKTSQILFFIIFVVFVLISRAKYSPNHFSNLIFYLDPLIAMISATASRAIVVGMLLVILTIIATILFGRVWCSWLCPLGSVFDWIKTKPSNAANPHERLRKIKYIAFIAILLLAIFGAEFYTFLDPITISQRALTISVFPALKAILYQAESLLYNFESLWGFLDWTHTQIIFPIFRDIDSAFRFSTISFLIIVFLIALNWIAERFWCRYLCPLGGLLGLLSKFSLYKRVVTNDCTSCGECARACPTATIDAKNGYISDPAECIMCFECKTVCHFNANQFEWKLPSKTPRQEFSYSPGRRDLLSGIGIAAGSIAFAAIDPKENEDIATMIRPPGAVKSKFDSACIRCSQCMNVCPTQGLQPTGLENGWADLFTPRLMPRIGYCDYNCTACIDICPTDAMGKLTLEDKQVTPIGLARIDQNRCLPWAYRTSCIICEEACPLPEKAIKFQEQHVTDHKGIDIVMKRPYVVRELCIGCGICEYKCPLTGEAAIQVYTLPQNISFLLPPGY